MTTPCPSCGTEVFALPGGGELSCPKCGHRWSTAGGPAWELFLQRVPGDLVGGPHDRVTLREWVYTRALHGEERVRAPMASSFERLGDRPEFAEILDLLGATGPRGGSRIAGWQVATPTPPEPAPATAPSLPPPAPPASAPRRDTEARTVVLLGALLFVILIALLAGLSRM